jgi:hypothetical protein
MIWRSPSICLFGMSFTHMMNQLFRTHKAIVFDSINPMALFFSPSMPHNSQRYSVYLSERSGQPACLPACLSASQPYTQ